MYRSWLSRSRVEEQQHQPSQPHGANSHSFSPTPPSWEPAPERSHTLGLFNEASDEDWERADEILPSSTIDRIRMLGCGAWAIEYPTNPRFVGRIERGNWGASSTENGTWKVCTVKRCKDTCLMSDLPLMAGLYDIHGKRGVYYEVRVNKMKGAVAIGTACKPYPPWRMPGWNRLSAGLHLDDMRKFFEDPNGGRDYTPEVSRISSGDVVGCGYEFASNALFFTHNGRRLPDAFRGVYAPRVDHDVYAAIGLDGTNEIEVNFGSSSFKWNEGNEMAWRVASHVGYMIGSGPGQDERLPSYSEATFR
ncbi:hypothetical protein B0F90DRAFT_1809128 [Multifurca ochricompacta]|uniref:B30.2/SPRY domain-containing protein n=1 Tax=Multifurca ochricompacta TaxID=376703 RepID=A0AAD4M7C2_9AGAM|nr:hypothetical protein B0F90DRAFT_1809128 [Multifurca ochricompacta]